MQSQSKLGAHEDCTPSNQSACTSPKKRKKLARTKISTNLNKQSDSLLLTTGRRLAEEDNSVTNRKQRYKESAVMDTYSSFTISVAPANRSKVTEIRYGALLELSRDWKPRDSSQFDLFNQRLFPWFGFLLETKSTTREMEKLRWKIGLCKGIFVDRTGLGGGLALFWRDSLMFQFSLLSRLLGSMGGLKHQTVIYLGETTLLPLFSVVASLDIWMRFQWNFVHVRKGWRSFMKGFRIV